MRRATRGLISAAAIVITLASAADANVTVSSLFSDHMVLQRGRPVTVWGTAAAGEKVTVSFAGRSTATAADERGRWRVELEAQEARTTPGTLTIAGANTITIRDVLVGDVWLCSGQSNMDMGLGACDRPQDVQGADFPGIRSFRVPLVAAGTPQATVKGTWVVCTPQSAGGFSAAAFYFARRIHQETGGKIPIGLLTASVGGTSIDLWVTPDGVADVPGLHALLKQPVMPGGPFSLSNGMIQPLAPYGLKGAIWYQGENAEKTKQSADSYFLKMKALQQGWRKLFGSDDLAFYYVMIANWGEKPRGAAPVFNQGGWDADTRLQQSNAMALPHAGCASALDIGDSSMGDRTWDGWHPKNKLDVGERLALWALKNDYGRPEIVASGPMLRDVSRVGDTVVCSFDHVGKGLMVGSRRWYEPTRELPDGTLDKFVVAGADGKWVTATAKIAGDTVVVSAPSVTEPLKVSYACWPNPEGCNLYNRDGLPTAPFHVEDVTRKHTITATAGAGGEISPAGKRGILPRMTALYTITPAEGRHIQDVLVDGTSVGAVTHYAFDPVYGDHTISATFGPAAPTYTIRVSAGGGGTVVPGSVTVPQGRSATFDVHPEGTSRFDVTVDGVSLGERPSIRFGDVRRNHTLSAVFFAEITASAGYGGTISPDGVVPVPYHAGQKFTMTPMEGHVIARVTVDGKEVAIADTHEFQDVTSSHSIAVTFKSLAGAGAGSVPRKDQLVFACLSDTLPADGPAASWPALAPAGKTLAAIAAPDVVTIDGRRYARIASERGQGFTVATYDAPIACQGASIVVAARPVRNGAGSGWNSIVDVFYDRLTLGVRNDTGVVCVRRNGGVEDGPTAIPSGQITILSLIVQPDGGYKVYANAREIMSNSQKSDMTALEPGVPGPFGRSITVGRNAPDGWTTFNGDIGDVFLYRTALTDAERTEVERFVAGRLGAGGP